MLGDTVAGSRHHWYSRLMARPWLWLLLLLPIMLLGTIGQSFILRRYLADRQLLFAKQDATLISASLASQRINSSGENVQDSIGTLHYGMNGTISIIDRGGIILAHPDPALITRDMSSEPVIEQVINAQTNGYVYNRLPDGAESILAFAVVPETGWHVLVEQPLNEAFDGVSGLLYSEVVISLVSMLLITFLVIMTLRRVAYPLRKLVAQVPKIGQGDISGLKRNETGLEEIVQLNRALYNMAQGIQGHQLSFQDHLTKIIEVQEAERRRLSHDLHDETMQGLVAIGQRLQLAQKALESGDKAAIGTTITNARTINQLVMDELRRTIRALRPISLEGAGLLSALEALLRDIQTHDIKVQLVVEGESTQLRPEIELTTFRVAQEALSNIVKHAQAKHVTMTVRFAETDIRLLVEDDGVGFTPADSAISYADGGHYGVVGMQERVAMVGGELKISSQPGQGTRVSACLPYSVENHQSKMP